MFKGQRFAILAMFILCLWKDVWHILRLNAEVADTASQKSFLPFCKFWCQNLNYRNIDIFIGHMSVIEKSTFSRWKVVKCSHQYIKMAKFRKYSWTNLSFFCWTVKIKIKIHALRQLKKNHIEISLTIHRFFCWSQNISVNDFRKKLVSICHVKKP